MLPTRHFWLLLILQNMTGKPLNLVSKAISRPRSTIFPVQILITKLFSITQEGLALSHSNYSYYQTRSLWVKLGGWKSEFPSSLHVAYMNWTTVRKPHMKTRKTAVLNWWQEKVHRYLLCARHCSLGTDTSVNITNSVLACELAVNRRNGSPSRHKHS